MPRRFVAAAAQLGPVARNETRPRVIERMLSLMAQGKDRGCDMMGHSCVIAPSGEIVALTSTLDDELLCYSIDLDATIEYKRFFDFATYRRPECYAELAKNE
jgi:predicted amidohydrolase